ncbi:MAG: TRAP transporter large permease [Candidatus Sedimenticola sp. 6PFRAG7]
MLIVTLLILLVLIALSIPIAAVLGTLAISLDNLYSMLPLYKAAGEIAWSSSTDFLLVAIPLFIMLGEIMLRAGMADRMYASLCKWVGWLPGGLMHSNVGACALFAATSGSSVATAATIGTVALPQVKKQGYNERLFLGTLAAGGTLGILIPPSINMIIYGVLTDTSVPKLYLAGIIPGIVLASIFMLLIIFMCRYNPAFGGVRTEYSWGEKFASLKDLIPPLIIFVVVVGAIYAGIATPTEAAALGVVGALVIAKFNGRLNLHMLREAMEGTMQTTAMVMLIIIAAYFLNFILSGIGLTDQLNGLIQGLGWTPMQTMLAVVLFYLVLGFFMETLSMMITTIPIVAPIIIQMGFDPVWFGILLMVLLETALITPPIGLNLYVVQGVRPGGGQVKDVIIGVIPFVIAMFLMIVILLLSPELATWLPDFVFTS